MSGISSDILITFSLGCFMRYNTYNGKIGKKFASTSNIMLKNLNKINKTYLLTI